MSLCGVKTYTTYPLFIYHMCACINIIRVWFRSPISQYATPNVAERTRTMAVCCSVENGCCCIVYGDCVLARVIVGCGMTSDAPHMCSTKGSDWGDTVEKLHFRYPGYDLPICLVGSTVLERDFFFCCRHEMHPGRERRASAHKRNAFLRLDANARAQDALH